MCFLTDCNAFERIKIQRRSFFRRCISLVAHCNTTALTCGVLTDSDTAVALRAVIEIVGVRRLRFVDRSNRYVVNRALGHFIVQCFQLSHVDSVSVFTACRYIGNLSCRTCFSYGYRPVTGLPSTNHLLFFFYCREEIRMCCYPCIPFFFRRCFFCRLSRCIQVSL